MKAILHSSVAFIFSTDGLACLFQELRGQGTPIKYPEGAHLGPIMPIDCDQCFNSKWQQLIYHLTKLCGLYFQHQWTLSSTLKTPNWVVHESHLDSFEGDYDVIKISTTSALNHELVWRRRWRRSSSTTDLLYDPYSSKYKWGHISKIIFQLTHLSVHTSVRT